MNTRQVLFAATAIGVFTVTSCGRKDAENTVTTVQSALPSIRVNANQIANLYRQAKAAGAPEFQGTTSAASILSALESGVHGSGIQSESTFKISPINESEREKTIALLEGILGN